MSKTKAPSQKPPTHPISVRQNPKLQNFSKLLSCRLKAKIALRAHAKAKAKPIQTKILSQKSPVSASSEMGGACLPKTGVSQSSDYSAPAPIPTSSQVLGPLPGQDESMMVAQAQASLTGFDEINQLIKKLTLSFSAKKNESSFFIKDGLFEGARFHVQCQQHNLKLSVNHLAPKAHQVLKAHQNYLRERLLQKEINLASVMLNS